MDDETTACPENAQSLPNSAVTHLILALVDGVVERYGLEVVCAHRGNGTDQSSLGVFAQQPHFVHNVSFADDAADDAPVVDHSQCANVVGAHGLDSIAHSLLARDLPLNANVAALGQRRASSLVQGVD